MGEDLKKEIIIRPAEGSNFKAKYRELLKTNPCIKDSFTTFNRIKRKIPRESLPSGMKEHKLNGRLKAFWECHLAPDILLTYRVDGNVLLLCDICRHDDLK